MTSPKAVNSGQTERASEAHKDAEREAFDLDAIEAAARAVTPQDIDSAESADHYDDGRHVECPACGGEGSVTLEADFLNYDGEALGVQFYGIGKAPGLAEAYFRAVKPATVLALIAEVRAARAASTQASAAATDTVTDAEPAAYLVRGIDSQNEEYASVWIKRQNADAAAAGIFRATITPLDERRAAAPQTDMTSNTRDSDAMREQFEKTLSVADSFRKADGTYVEPHVQAAWIARQASETAGMNLGERIAHVGGRTSEAGYIEFDSVMAVDALIKHLLSDMATARTASTATATDGEPVAEVRGEFVAMLRSRSLVPVGTKLYTRAAAPQGLTDERINELARTHLVAGDDGEIFGLEKFARALLAEQSAAPMALAVPDGWKLVPVEPTEEMIQAACLTQSNVQVGSYSEWRDNHSSGISERIRELVVRDYHAMLAAFPAAESEAVTVPLTDDRIMEIMMDYIPPRESLLLAGKLMAFSRALLAAAESKTLPRESEGES